MKKVGRSLSRSSRAGLAVAVMSLALVGAGGVTGAAETGCLLFKDAADDAVNSALLGDDENTPNLDILSGGIVKETPAKGDEPATFTTQIEVADLTKDFEQNATANMTWYFQWSYDGVDYYSVATLARFPGDTVTYSFGTYEPPRFVSIGSTTGSFNEGPKGTVQVDVPVEQVGGPQSGAELTNTYANSRVGLGSPTGSPSLVTQIDRGPDGEEFGEAAKLGSCSGVSKLKSPKPRLAFSDKTPKRGSTVKAISRLKTCKGLDGTKMRLQKKRKGSFKTIATKKLSSKCKANFRVKANFKKATFRSQWPKQAKAFRSATSKPVTVRTH